jgi:type IV pilus assembly protein PilO
VSTTAVTPTPENKSPLLRRVPQMTERARALVTELNLHFAGVALLAILTLYLGAQLLFVWQGLSSRNDAALDAARAQMKAAEIAAKPLRGLDGKLAGSTADADRFYQDRLPYAYSQVLTELGSLTKKSGVRLMHVQYAQSPVLADNYALTELRLDANVTGDYRPIVQFINAAERDKLFFVIRGINLSGQQTGQVNLRLTMTTYLRAQTVKESVSDTAAGAVADSDAAGTGAKGGTR